MLFTAFGFEFTRTVPVTVINNRGSDTHRQKTGEEVGNTPKDTVKRYRKSNREDGAKGQEEDARFWLSEQP